MKRTVYNIEQNLWGVNVQLRGKSQLWDANKPDTYITTTPLSEAQSKPTVIELEFKHGIPIRLNGEQMEPVALVEQLTKIGGRNAIGRFATVENRITGIKTREIYESPAACILYRALTELESVIIDKDTLHFMPTVSQKYSMLVYEGRWFSPLRQALDKFVNDIQKQVSGKITLELLKGNMTLLKIDSPYSRL
jgi:argininosuccinate synthase